MATPDIPKLVTIEDLEQRIGATKVSQLLQTLGAPLDGVATVSPEVIDGVLLTGSSEAADRLFPGFAVPEIVELVAASPSLKAAVAWICIGMAAEGRGEFTDQNGNFVYAAPYKKALDKLKDTGSKAGRAAAEGVTGHANATVGGTRVNLRGSRPRVMHFARTADHQKPPGGF